MKHIQTSILALLVAIVFLGASIAAYVIIFTDLKRKNEYISKTTGELAGETAKKQKQLELERTIQESDADRTVLNSYFVSADKAVAFLETMEGYGKTGGTVLKFTTVDYNKTKDNLHMVLNITGEFVQVYHTILLLENAPYEFSFERITLSLQQSVNSSEKKDVTVPMWRADITMNLESFTSK